MKKYLKNKTLKNSIWILGEKVAQALMTLIITILSARYLGPGNYGLLSYGTTLISIFLVVAKLGIDSIIINEIINDRNNEGEYLGTSIVLRIFTSIISIILIYIYMLIFQRNNNLIIILTMIQSIVLFLRAFEIIDYWFQSYLKSKYVSIARVVAYLAMTIYKIYLLVTKKSVIWFAFSTLIDYGLIAVFLCLFYKKNKGQKWKFSIETSKKILSKSYHFIITGIMVVIYTQIDKLMIGNILGNEKLGIYTAATSICTMWIFLPEAILMSLRPSVIEKKKQNNAEYKKRLKQTYSVIFWICFVLSLITCIASPIIIKILYGKDYLEAISSLRLLIWYVPFSQLGTASSLWLVCEEKGKYAKYYALIGVIMNICMNYFLINKIGINGAIIATLITEFITNIIAPLFFKETREQSKLLIEAIFFKF